jgi:hypothetical protein
MFQFEIVPEGQPRSRTLQELAKLFGCDRSAFHLLDLPRPAPPCSGLTTKSRPSVFPARDLHRVCHPENLTQDSAENLNTDV